jgi:hypothetical protein
MCRQKGEVMKSSVVMWQWGRLAVAQKVVNDLYKIFDATPVMEPLMDALFALNRAERAIERFAAQTEEEERVAAAKAKSESRPVVESPDPGVN